MFPRTTLAELIEDGPYNWNGDQIEEVGRLIGDAIPGRSSTWNYDELEKAHRLLKDKLK